MSAQLSIDFEPRRLARRADPATSHDAAARVNEFGGHQHELILSVLRANGPCTTFEVANHCYLDAHKVGKRMNELFEGGRIRVVLDGVGKPMTRKTPSGRSARVWFAI